MNERQKKYVVNKFIINKLMKTQEVRSEINKEARPRREGGNGGDRKRATQSALRKYKRALRSIMTLLRDNKYIESICFKGKTASFVRKMIVTCPEMNTRENAAHKITKVGLKRLRNPSKRKPRKLENTFMYRM